MSTRVPSIRIPIRPKWIRIPPIGGALVGIFSTTLQHTVKTVSPIIPYPITEWQALLTSPTNEYLDIAEWQAERIAPINESVTVSQVSTYSAAPTNLSSSVSYS